MRNVTEGLRWLDQAEADVKTARDCLEDGNYYASAFFSQQATEKALKGFLYFQGYRAIITYSVTELLEECSEFGKEFKQFVDYGKELDRHYIVQDILTFTPQGHLIKFYTEEVAKSA
ncbi:MAG: hypothetical protein C0169_05555 [Thermodesulfobacterium geofontis]|uniref:HEPN domain-containing protein n=1 Tax=Thermodesulfobacterium geofontis TaxID=1295609 RepID=A0A2N7QA71_9BACT|nr:MAG: hypothetical protein C0169_05555 [Thermodesulfobacterium geofontis]